jgi:hypothetical protein
MLPEISLWVLFAALLITENSFLIPSLIQTISHLSGYPQEKLKVQTTNEIKKTIIEDIHTKCINAAVLEEAAFRGLPLFATYIFVSLGLMPEQLHWPILAVLFVAFGPIWVTLHIPKELWRIGYLSGINIILSLTALMYYKRPLEGLLWCMLFHFIVNLIAVAAPTIFQVHVNRELKIRETVSVRQDEIKPKHRRNSLLVGPLTAANLRDITKDLLTGKDPDKASDDPIDSLIKRELEEMLRNIDAS